MSDNILDELEISPITQNYNYVPDSDSLNLETVDQENFEYKSSGFEYLKDNFKWGFQETFAYNMYKKFNRPEFDPYEEKSITPGMAMELGGLKMDRDLSPSEFEVLKYEREESERLRSRAELNFGKNPVGSLFGAASVALGFVADIDLLAGYGAVKVAKFANTLASAARVANKTKRAALSTSHARRIGNLSELAKTSDKVADTTRDIVHNVQQLRNYGLIDGTAGAVAETFTNIEQKYRGVGSDYPELIVGAAFFAPAVFSLVPAYYKGNLNRFRLSPITRTDELEDLIKTTELKLKETTRDALNNQSILRNQRGAVGPFTRGLNNIVKETNISNEAISFNLDSLTFDLLKEGRKADLEDIYPFLKSEKSTEAHIDKLIKQGVLPTRDKITDKHINKIFTTNLENLSEFFKKQGIGESEELLASLNNINKKSFKDTFLNIIKNQTGAVGAKKLNIEKEILKLLKPQQKADLEELFPFLKSSKSIKKHIDDLIEEGVLPARNKITAKHLPKVFITNLENITNYTNKLGVLRDVKPSAKMRLGLEAPDTMRAFSIQKQLKTYREMERYQKAIGGKRSRTIREIGEDYNQKNLADDLNATRQFVQEASIDHGGDFSAAFVKRLNDIGAEAKLDKGTIKMRGTEIKLPEEVLSNLELASNVVDIRHIQEYLAELSVDARILGIDFNLYELFPFFKDVKAMKKRLKEVRAELKLPSKAKLRKEHIDNLFALNTKELDNYISKFRFKDALPEENNKLVESKGDNVNDDLAKRAAEGDKVAKEILNNQKQGKEAVAKYEACLLGGE